MPVHVKSTPRWRKNQNKIITIPALHMVYYKSIVLVYIFLMFLISKIPLLSMFSANVKSKFSFRVLIPVSD